MDIFGRFETAVADAVAGLVADGTLPAPPAGLPPVEPPRDPAHGDLASSAALELARSAGAAPRELATRLAFALARHPDVERAEVAGPGFVNLVLRRAAWEAEILRILEAGADYGRGPPRNEALPINVEYVSANPTGPLHMGHGRGAVVGDALANLLAFVGHRVEREYYINDAGAQVDALARSVHWRYREALGLVSGPVPSGLYPGSYLVPLGQELARELGPGLADAPEAQWLPAFRERAVAAMMADIREDLAALGIRHDRFTSEAELLARGAPARAEERLRAMGLVYDGRLPPPRGDVSDDWEPVDLPLFRSTAFGDDVDRPIRKSDGSWTYFGADMAYHAEKAERASALVDVWGADHAGTVKRIEAAVAALTGGRVPLTVKLVQMVRLFRGGEPVRMSKRAGDFVTLREVVEEVGRDVVRFMMLTKRPESPLDFDFVKVVEQSRDNPVFYVHYAHARIRSVERRAADAGLTPPADPPLDRLDDAELRHAKLLAQWPRVVTLAARALEPHRVAFFLQEVAGSFHALWNRGNDDPAFRILVDGDPGLSAARLALAQATAIVIRAGLGIMGVEPVEELH
ncbi:MAG: arginine--tRNA ligase [Sphingomonadaceae bacterium]|uniref:arginine--tRNA ligase n=1 Tax=Thermaurantiacus sp. TaxID=2820283 RepID=UPI00298EDD59|nr:arginine--tRNA ligase [Thermaurantiacus sp.]MCS6986109.1 arginine--tRNA ligase [Sphingomonadaceae bacterium]MDW8414675.1 arginine--tRNA ligase [Thermaurantiacus sp.]